MQHTVYSLDLVSESLEGLAVLERAERQATAGFANRVRHLILIEVRE